MKKPGGRTHRGEPISDDGAVFLPKRCDRSRVT